MAGRTHLNDLSLLCNVHISMMYLPAGSLITRLKDCAAIVCAEGQFPDRLNRGLWAVFQDGAADLLSRETVNFSEIFPVTWEHMHAGDFRVLAGIDVLIPPLGRAGMRERRGQSSLFASAVAQCLK